MDSLVAFLARAWVQRVGFVLGGLLVGILSDRVLQRWLTRAAQLTSNTWDDVLASGLRGLPRVLFFAAGLYVALGVGALDPFLFDTGLKLVTVLVLGSVIVGAMRVSGAAVERVASRSGGALPSSTLVVKLTKGCVALLGLFIILQNLDVQIAPLLTALGVGGLAVALALQDTLGNLFAGVQIIMSRQVRPGDYVRLSTGEEGHVTDVKARNTTIMTFPDDNLVVVPNSTMASSIVKNYSMPRDSLWVTVGVGVSYDSDLDHVERVSREVASGVLEDLDTGSKTSEPVFRYLAFGDSSINYEIRMEVQEFTAQAPVRHEFIKRLHRRFAEEGIVIPFPIRTVHMRQPPSD